MNKPKTFATVDAIDQGGAYEMRDSVCVRVEEPTTPPPGASAPGSEQGAEAGPGAVVGATTGEPSAPAEAAGAKARRKP